MTKKLAVFADNLVQTAFALNRQANQIAQAQPIFATELLRAAYGLPRAIAKRVAAAKAQGPAQSIFALNRKANQIAQVQPHLAAQLRLLAAYA